MSINKELNTYIPNIPNIYTLPDMNKSKSTHIPTYTRTHTHVE